MIELRCPQCYAGLRVKEDKVGTKAKCPKCGQEIVVPLVKADALPPIPDPAPVKESQDFPEPLRFRTRGLTFAMVFCIISGIICIIFVMGSFANGIMVAQTISEDFYTLFVLFMGAVLFALAGILSALNRR